MADPFATTGQNAPSQDASGGFMGMSPSFWANLANFGAQTLAAANARTADGHLLYPGAAGALGAGYLGAEQQSAQQAASAAQTQGQVISNETSALQIPFLRARLAAYEDALKQPQQTSGTNAQPSPAPLSNSGVLPATGAAITATESNGNTAAQNAQGYLGGWQAGTAALASDGLYVPAQGEDLTQNQWKGTINVPGFGSMTPAQYQQNPQAQDAALQIHMNNVLGQFQKNGADKYIGQTIGGVPITVPSLVAMANIGGVGGTMKYLQSGGQYDPVDANGTSMSVYATDVLSKMPSQAQTGNADPSNPLGAMPPMQLYQMGMQLYQKSQRDAMIGLPSAAAEQDQAGKLLDYAFAAWKPQNLRSGSVLISPVGVIKDNQIGTIYDGANIGHPASMSPDVTLNGQPMYPGTVTPLQTDGTSGASVPPTFGLMGYSAPGGAASGTPGGVQTTPNQFQTELNDEQVKAITEGQTEAETQSSAAATMQTYLQQMRQEAKNFQPGDFAGAENGIATTMLSLAQGMKIDPSQFTELNKVTGNYAAFQKDSTNLVAAMLKSVGGRITVAEMNYFKTGIPSASSPENAIQMVTDQLQAINSLAMAKSQAYGQWMQQAAAGTPEAQTIRNTGFQPWFNSHIGPTAFLFNEWSQTPEGQAQLKDQVATLSQSDSGKALLKTLSQQIQWGQQNGLFNIAADASQ